MATHSSVLAGEIPWTEEPGATVCGVPKSRTRPLNKAKGKLFLSLSLSLLLFSCLYIFNFHLGLSGFIYLYFFFPFFRISLFSFIHSLSLSPSISVAYSLYSLFLFFYISLTPPHLFLWIIPLCVHSFSQRVPWVPAEWKPCVGWGIPKELTL